MTHFNTAKTKLREENICSKCGAKFRIRESVSETIEHDTLCDECFAKAQPLVKVNLPDGGYLPWSRVHSFDINGELVTRHLTDDPTNGDEENVSMPKVAFCEKHKKWKITYTGTEGYANDNAATTVERYYDSIEELLAALGINCR